MAVVNNKDPIHRSARSVAIGLAVSVGSLIIRSMASERIQMAMRWRTDPYLLLLQLVNAESEREHLEATTQHAI